ncbi:Ldh family oxidoreductase [Mesorhizobium xinjiangense]|uniref:Ldh family oxidoreductase n=1 Tax=Mesorhizobium xinjiangense TaxID=2678685 RepID=UPI0012ED19BC|nr:Ldh family oxidoreductase [Mesorhizobium xinjiangense]
MRFPAGQLRQVAVAALERHGAPPDKAQLQADILIEAELRGLPSHGLQRLPRLLARIDRGLADPHASGTATWSRKSFLSVDGQGGLGPVVLMAAMRKLESAAAIGGIAAAAVRNANHIGMLAYYAEAAARAGLIGIVASTSEALVHPHGGTQAMLGTNPMAVGIPTDSEPFVLDLATSIVSMGKIHNHALRGEPIPAGWAVDAAGRSTTDPEAAKGGAIAPFGGAKGYGLGLGIELLVAALAGSGLAPEVRGTLDDTHPANKGDLLILIDPAAGAGDAATLGAYLDALRSSGPADPNRPVAIPGDGSRARRGRGLSSGVDVPDALFDTLSALAAA